jgi:LemA protein
MNAFSDQHVFQFIFYAIIFGVVEKYPDLKVSQQFLKLQSELVNIEDRIQASRRFYNGNIRDLNTMIQSFPSNIIAGLFSFKTQEFFEIEDTGVGLPTAVSFNK